MNIQARQFYNTRWFQIGILVALAVVLMVGAAFWFGIGLQADTARSVAPSPIGSSLTAVRESRLDDYYGRLSDASTAARAASLAALAPLANSRSDIYEYLNGSAAAAASSSAGLSAAEYAAESGVPAASISLPESARTSSSAADSYQNEWMGFTAPESVGAKLSVSGGFAPDSSASIKPEGINPSAAVDSAAKQYPWIEPMGIEASRTK